jgi:hypothetical protein
MHFLAINRAGRRILTFSRIYIPLGLWPLVLERAGKKISYLGFRYHDPRWGQGPRRANAVFFLMRNLP